MKSKNGPWGFSWAHAQFVHSTTFRVLLSSTFVFLLCGGDELSKYIFSHCWLPQRVFMAGIVGHCREHVRLSVLVFRAVKQGRFTRASTWVQKSTRMAVQLLPSWHSFLGSLEKKGGWDFAPLFMHLFVAAWLRWPLRESKVCYLWQFPSKGGSLQDHYCGWLPGGLAASDQILNLRQCENFVWAL